MQCWQMRGGGGFPSNTLALMTTETRSRDKGFVTEEAEVLLRLRFSAQSE